MNKLKKLSSVLYSQNLKAEASEILRLLPVEHPDWSSWSKEEEENLLTSVVPKTTAVSRLEEGDPLSPDVVIDKKLRELGITIIPSSGRLDWIGEGKHGKVYNCAYNGKSAVAKIQAYPVGMAVPYGQDVSSWQRLMSVWDTLPDWVQKYFPKVLFSHEEVIQILGPFGMEDYSLQVMVMERLSPLPKELTSVLFGSSNDPTRWSEALDELYPLLYHIMESNGLSSPPKKEIIESLRDTSQKGALTGRITRPFYNIIRNSKIPFEKTGPLMDQISGPIHSMSKKMSIPIPAFSAWIQDWEAPDDVAEFWKAISWLRRNRIPTGDISYGNVMIDSAGQIKISDLGSLF
jgi:serine/threonine protein kinase